MTPAKLPKGYRITTRKDRKTGLYDCSVWLNGAPVLFSAPTLFNYPEQVREWARDWINNYQEINP